MTAQRYNFFLFSSTHNTKKDDDVYEVKPESRKKNWFCVKPFATIYVKKTENEITNRITKQDNKIKKEINMKKIVLTLVAAMAFTLSFAETKSYGTDKSEEGNDVSLVNNFNTRFVINCDIRRLAAVLDLDEWQTEAVEASLNSFNEDVKSLSAVSGPRLGFQIHQALKKDAFQMHRVLNEQQFNTYMRLLLLTLRNQMH